MIMSHFFQTGLHSYQFRSYQIHSVKFFIFYQKCHIDCEEGKALSIYKIILVENQIEHYKQKLNYSNFNDHIKLFIILRSSLHPWNIFIYFSFSRKYTRHQNDIGADSTSYPSSYDKDLQGNDQPSISSSSSHRVQIFQQPQAFRFQSNPALTSAKSSLQEFAHGDTTSFSSFTQLNVGPKEQFDALDTLNVKQRTAGNFPKLDPEKVKRRNPVQTIKTTGSKWDQFVEEDQDSLEDSEDEQENVCPVSNQGTSFQQRDNLPKYENRVNQELFSIDDLEDSDFQIYE